MNAPGDVVLVDGHYWVAVASCPQGLLIVNITSVKPDFAADPACLLAAGELKFIKRPSYVIYYYAKIESAEQIKARLMKQEVNVRNRLTPEQLLKIQRGFLTSKYASPRYRQMIQDLLNNGEKPPV